MFYLSSLLNRFTCIYLSPCQTCLYTAIRVNFQKQFWTFNYSSKNFSTLLHWCNIQVLNDLVSQAINELTLCVFSVTFAPSSIYSCTIFCLISSFIQPSYIYSFLNRIPFLLILISLTAAYLTLPVLLWRIYFNHMSTLYILLPTSLPTFGNLQFSFLDLSYLKSLTNWY